MRPPTDMHAWRVLGWTCLLAGALSARAPRAGEPPPSGGPRPPAAPALEPALPVNMQGKVCLGEQLEYEVAWRGMPAGRALLIVQGRGRFPDRDGPETWNIRLDVRSSRAVAALYQVHNKARTEMDAKGGFSRFFWAKKEEEDYLFEEQIKFDYTLDHLEASYDQTRLDGTHSTRGLPLPGKVLDPLCALYYLRGVDQKALTGAQPLSLPICTERRVWKTTLRLLSAEELRSRNLRPEVDVPGVGPAQPCLVFEPECEFNGLFLRKGPLLVWLHQATQVPVKMQVETPLGFCEVTLIRHVHSPFDNPPATPAGNAREMKP